MYRLLALKSLEDGVKLNKYEWYVIKNYQVAFKFEIIVILSKKGGKM